MSVDYSIFPYKCDKCGAKFYSIPDMNKHSSVCDGFTGINMDMIEGIANKVSKKEYEKISFTCEICGGHQNINGIHNWGKEIIFPVCDNCKKDLKEIILNKQKQR